jgi:hypothetical protein
MNFVLMNVYEQSRIYVSGTREGVKSFVKQFPDILIGHVATKGRAPKYL